MVQSSSCPPLCSAEVVRSADLISYTAEEGLRYFGEASRCLLYESNNRLVCLWA